MANFDDLSLPLQTPGAVVLLREPPTQAWLERMPDGVDVQLSTQSRGVLVANLPDVALGELPLVARDFANRALDLITIRSAGSYALSEPRAPSVCWSPSAVGPAVRITSEVHSTFGMTIGGAPRPYALHWHECMRYFRTAQTTTDLFDAFRNLYLALESLLSHIAPVRVRANGRPEGEGQWTKRALGQADAVLRRFNPAMTIGAYLSAPAVSDPITDVYDELYAGIRTAIFHAKNGRVFALPQNRKDRAQIESALGRYNRLFTDLAEAQLGARFLTSGIAATGFAAMADGLLQRWEVGVSGREFPNELEAEAAAALITLPTRRAPAHDGLLRAAVVGEARMADVPEIQTVRTVGARTTDGRLVTVESLRGVLTVHGAASLEHLLTYQAFNKGVKSQYDS